MESLSFSPRHPEGKKSPPFQSFPSCFIHIVLPPLTFLDPATAPQNRDTTWKVMQKVRGTEVKMRGSGARKKREREKKSRTDNNFIFLFSFLHCEEIPSCRGIFCVNGGLSMRSWPLHFASINIIFLAIFYHYT